jgi:periplasmic mercuric ion binding protein
MKTKSIYLILILALATSGLFAQTKTVKTNIKVYGNCAMCKERIESALDRPGIKFASWNTASKSLEVVYNNRKISEKEIHEIIAATGHDTEEVKAKDEVYAKLPFCCLYRDHDHSNIIDEPHKH